MDLAAVDRTLAQFRETIGVMSTNLVDLESDAAQTRLDTASLTGTTAAQWSTAHGALEALWQWYAQLNDVVEKASQLRGTKSRLDPEQLAQLDSMVNGPSIELSESEVPLAERGLFGAAETTRRCSPAELLGRMKTAFAQVTAVVEDCRQRWATLEARLAPLDDQLAEADRLADVLGERHRPELDTTRHQLDELRQAVMCDPLAASDRSVDAVATSLGSVLGDLGRLTHVRDNLSAQLDEARALSAELRSTVAAAADARAQAVVKILRPAVVDPQVVAVNVEMALERIAQTAARGDWRSAASLLAGWTARSRSALAEAQRALVANRAPLAARDELRGRLDAYRAKAYRLGRLEDATVAGLYARAKNALFTAPTDLTEAEELVARYQQAVGGSAPREVAT